MREVGTWTNWQICLWQWWWPSVIGSSCTSVPCRDTDGCARAFTTHTQPSTLQPERYEFLKSTFQQLPSDCQGETGHSSLLSPCCSCAFTSQSATLPVSEAMREAPRPWQKGDNMRQTIMPQWTSHLSLPAWISHLLWPSVREDYVLEGHEAADIPALTQAPPLCCSASRDHTCMHVPMRLCLWCLMKAVFVLCIFEGGGRKGEGGPKKCFWANQCWNVFTCRGKELILSKIFKKQGLLICKLGAGLRHLSEEASCYNPQPLYKQQFVYSYTLWIASGHKTSW